MCNITWLRVIARTLEGNIPSGARPLLLWTAVQQVKTTSSARKLRNRVCENNFHLLDELKENIERDILNLITWKIFRRCEASLVMEVRHFDVYNRYVNNPFSIKL